MRCDESLLDVASDSYILEVSPSLPADFWKVRAKHPRLDRQTSFETRLHCFLEMNLFRRWCVGSEDGIEDADHSFPESFICMTRAVVLGRKGPCLASNNQPQERLLRANDHHCDYLLSSFNSKMWGVFLLLQYAYGR